MPRDERTVTILDRRLLHRSAVGGVKNKRHPKLVAIRQAAADIS